MHESLALQRAWSRLKRQRICWSLDQLGGDLKHVITLLEDVQALGGAFVSLAEGIDATTPAGNLQMHILGAIAEFERERIRERVLAVSRGQGRRGNVSVGLGSVRHLEAFTGPSERLRRTGGVQIDGGEVDRRRTSANPRFIRIRSKSGRALCRCELAFVLSLAIGKLPRSRNRGLAAVQTPDKGCREFILTSSLHDERDSATFQLP